jgi:hypothetical protein
VSKNDLSMGYRFLRHPRGMSLVEALRAMRAALDEDGELPNGLGVEWRWRNTAAQDERWDEFANVVRGSREGFVTVMKRRLDRDLLRAEQRAREVEEHIVSADRSAAARRGWVTRRANAAERERVRRKRLARRRVRAAKRKGQKRR